MINFKELLEKAGAGDWGTDEATKTLKKGTPGENMDERRITDIDVEQAARDLKHAKLKKAKEKVQNEATDFRAGDTVHQVGSKLKGTVLHKGNQDKIVVKFGSVNKMIPADQLRLAEEVELDEGKLDKSSPIYKEYEALKKKPVSDLRNIIGRSHRVADLKGYDKAGAIRQILDDKFGEKKVDAFFGFSEEVKLDEEKVIKIVADTNTRKYKEGQVIKTFPETKAGLTRAMVFQKTVKDRDGAETTMVRESVELDEARAARPPKLKGNSGPYTRQQIEKAAKEAKVDIGAKSRMMMALRKMNEEIEELDEGQWGADNPYKKYKNDPQKLKRMLSKNQDAAGNMRNRIRKFMGSAPSGLKDELRDIENRIKQIKDVMREEVELDEGAVAVSTVEKEIRKNGATRVKKSDSEITFMYKGSERKIPVDRGFVKSGHYMKIQDMMEEVE